MDFPPHKSPTQTIYFLTFNRYFLTFLSVEEVFDHICGQSESDLVWKTARFLLPVQLVHACSTPEHRVVWDHVVGLQGKQSGQLAARFSSAVRLGKSFFWTICNRSFSSRCWTQAARIQLMPLRCVKKSSIFVRFVKFTKSLKNKKHAGCTMSGQSNQKPF